MISGVFLVLLAPSLIAVQFYFAEYVAVTVFALTAVAAVSEGHLLRGLFTSAIGLLLATVGLSEQDGLSRFDFGYRELMGGISLIPALIGLFAISQIMHDMSGRAPRAERAAERLERILPTTSDLARNALNYVRSGLIGTFVGILPGLGGGPAGLISYAQARNASREPGRFGKVAIEGVVAAETANNATIGGALIITLALGIPGDPVMAILIGGMMVQGVAPGPLLFQHNPDVIYLVYFTVFVGSLFIMLTLLVSMRWLARIVDVPQWILAPVILALASTGVYALNNRMFDVLVMFAAGALGYVLERFRYPLAPLILGLVLGPILEENLRKLLSSRTGALPLFTTPIPLTFLALSALFITYSLYREHRSKRPLAHAG